MRGKSRRTLVPEDGKLTCPHCSKSWEPRGFENHQRACKDKAERAKKDAEVLRRIAKQERCEKRARASADAPVITDWGLGTSVRFNSYENSPIPETSVVDTDSQAPCERDERVPSPSHPESDRTSTSQLEFDDIRVEFHPHSGLGTKIYRFEEYQRERLQPQPPDPEPWKPFMSREDFEFAEVVQQAGMTEEQVKTLLRIITGVADGTSAFSLREYKDLTHAWEKAILNQPSFKKHQITVPHHSGERMYDVYVRDIEELIIKQLQDPNLIQYFQWDARRMSKWKGSYWEDFVESEPVTGSKMWDVQSNIPEDAKPLGIFLYADKNKLSSFGTQQGYPVIMRITNIETHVRHGDGLGGGHVVAFLPVVKEEAGETGKTSFANFKREVWHAAVDKIIEPLIPLSKVGLAVRCADAVRRLFYIFLNILSGDYEELCSMLLIRGNRCLYPCPMCLVPADELLNLSKEWPLRTAQQAQALFAKYTRKGDLNEATQELGIRPIQNVFWKLDNSDPHEAASVDNMHMDESGTFGHHAFSEFKALLEKKRPLSTQIDANFQAMPRWRGLNHFESGVLNVNFTDATKYNDISKVIVYTAFNVFDHRTHPRGYSLLKLIRKYTECHTYLAMEVHTEATLNDLYRTILQLQHCVEEYKTFTDQDEKPKDWNFIKLHLRVHGIRDILAKGTLVSMTTKISEKFHGPMRKDYSRRTNFKNVLPQLALLNDIAFCARTIREKINIYDAFMKAQSEDEDLSELETTEFRFHQIYLGSRQAELTLRDVELQHASDRAFHEFRLKLNRFLFSLAISTPREEMGFPANMLITPTTIRLSPDNTIVECRFLKVNYECMCTGREDIDYLRCNPSFHGRPRYDGIIFQDVSDKHTFAKLIYMFVCTLSTGHTVPIALVLPMDRAVGPTRKSDIDLGLCRVKAGGRQDARFIPLRSVIRGALLYQNPSEPDEFLAIDLVDSDMFLRLRELFPKRFQ